MYLMSYNLVNARYQCIRGIVMKLAKMVIGLSLFLGLSAIAQDYQSYFEEFDVVLQQLQVNVRDKSGNHVAGLKKGDFEIRIKGRLQEIQSVEEVSVDSWMETKTVEEIPQQARRLFVLFFDLRYSTKKGILAARDGAREYVLTDMLPSDLVSVFVYHPLSGVSMVTNFTSDQNQALMALDSLGLKDAKNVVQGPAGYFTSGQLDTYLADLGAVSASNTGVDGSLDTTGRAGFELAAIDHLVEITAMANRVENAIYQREVVGFLNSMEKFADGLRLIRGRKNLIWFSTGFDSTGLVGASHQEIIRNEALIHSGQTYRVSSDQYGRTQVQHEAAEAVEHLQASGAVIFAVDTSMNANDRGALREGLQTLNMFAMDTGGKVYQNYNDLGAPLAEVAELTNDYYLLSFYPEVDLKKGKIGRMKISANYPGAKVYASHGIMVEPDFKKLTKLEKQIHLSEYLGRDQMVAAIPIQVSVLQVPHSDKLVKLSVGVEMRGDYFLNKSPREFEVHTAAITLDNNHLFDRAFFRFKLDPEKVRDILASTGIKYFGNIFVKPGDYKLKVVVRDMVSGKVGSHIQNLKVDNADLSVSGPMLLTNNKWVMIREEEAKERLVKAGNLDFSYPYRFSGRNLVPQTTALVDGQKSKFFFYLLSDREFSSETAPTVRAVVVDEENNVYPIPKDALTGGAEFRGGESNTIVYVLKVDFESLKLASGANYQLMTQFDVGDREPIRSSASFMIE